MELLLIILFSLIVGFVSGYFYNQRSMIMALAEMVQDQIQELTHEISDGVHYLYYADSRAFASQGNTIDEAAANYGVNTKNQGVGHVTRSSTGTQFLIIDGKIEPLTDTV